MELIVFLQTVLSVCLANIQMEIMPWQEQMQNCLSPSMLCPNLYDRVGVTTCCGFCNCEEDCAVYGSCCLPVYRNFQHGIKSVTDTRYKCVKLKYPEVYDGKIYKQDDAAWMVARCSSSNVDYVTKTLCEKPGLNNSLESIVPVTDFALHYRNRFCAMCNGIDESEQLLNWQLKLECNSSLTLSYETALEKVTENGCNISFYPPEQSIPEKLCIPQSYTISSCNVTGLWPVYNETIDLACKAYIDVFKGIYKNIFCFVCNTDEFIPPASTDCPYVMTTDIIFPNFIAVIDVSALKSAEIENRVHDALFCDSSTQFRDEKNRVCRNMSCDTSRKLVNQVCVIESGRHCYTMFVKITPEEHRKYDFFQIFDNTSLIGGLSSLLKDQENSAYFFKMYENKLLHLQRYNFFPVYSLLQLSVVTTVDTVSYLIRIFHKRTDLKLSDVRVFSEIVYADYFVAETKDKLIVNIPNERTNSMDILESYIDDVFEWSFNICDVRPLRFPVLDRLHVCPIIQLDFTELKMRIVDNTFLLIEETFIRKRLPRWEFRHQNGKILICLSTYISIYSSMPEPLGNVTVDAGITSWSKTDINVGLKEYVAFICVCLSILCLIVTTVTYFMHRELHSQPGINTITLSISLLLAQAMYQFGSGQTNFPKWACSLIGALCHFLWLTVMFSMNACSVSMFLVFKNLKIISPRYSKSQTTKTIGYVVLFSLAFVLINIVYSGVESRGESIGYGDNLCYFSSFWMQLITFIAPSILIVLVNIALFICVIIFISKTVPRGSNLNQERNYFAIYTRLSTLTGLTWLAGFLQLIIKSDILEYLFIILNGSQGIFLMIAFVLNNKVYNIWCKKSTARSEIPLQAS